MTDEERFWSKVDQRGIDECWPWMAGRHGQGYGMFYLAPKNRKAHRIAWEFARSPIPPGMCVCHACDHPWCCNPAHLFLGTQADNVHDMCSKHRLVAPRGEQQNSAKLTDQIVREARVLYAAGGVTLQELGHRYGVTKAVMHKAVKRIYWGHVQ
jgi:hypothetical protein